MQTLLTKASTRKGARAFLRYLASALFYAFAVYLLNPEWLVINAVSPPWFDPFIYLGLFIHPFDYPNLHPGYYPTSRSPWILYGAAFYHIFEPNFANIVMKMCTFVVVGCLVLSTLGRVGVKTPVALVCLGILSSYPFFIMTIGWEYVDCFIVLMFSFTYWAISIQSPNIKTRNINDILAGVFFTSAVVCHLFAGFFAFAFALFLIAVMIKSQTFSLHCFIIRTCHIVFGCVLTVTFVACYNGMIGADQWPIFSQVKQAFAYQEGGGFDISSRAFLLPSSVWLALPISLVLICLISIGLNLFSWKSSHNSLRLSQFEMVVALHFILGFLILVTVSIISIAAITLWFYVSAIIIPGIITLGVILNKECRLSSSPTLICMALFSISLLLVHSPFIGLKLNFFWSYFGLKAGDLLQATIALLFGLTILTFSARLHRIAHLILACFGFFVVVCAFSSMYSNSQLNYTRTPERLDAFNVMLEASDAIVSSTGGGNSYIWLDRGEEGYGGLLHSTWILSFMGVGLPLNFNLNVAFPNIPAEGFDDGRQVVILTANANWKAVANIELNKQRMQFIPINVKVVERGNIKVRVIAGVVESLLN